MRVTAADLQRAWPPRAKYLLFGAIGLMMLIVLQNNERFLIDPKDPIWQHYQPFKWYLLPHGIAGTLALFLGVLQFSDKLRARYLKWHRMAGRVYVGCVFVLGPLGYYIQRTLGQPNWTIATIVDASLFMSTTAMGLWMVKSGNIQAHRQWMTRSYAVAIIFLEVRIIEAVPWFVDRIDPNSAVELWICLVLALPMADLVLQCEEMLKKRASTKRVAMAAAV